MSAGGGDADFSTGAELTLSIADRELSAIRSQIENELSDIPIGVDASGVGGGRMQPRDPSTGRFMSIEGVEQRVIEQTELQVELLDDIKDAVEGGGGGGGGGLGLGGAAIAGRAGAAAGGGVIGGAASSLGSAAAGAAGTALGTAAGTALLGFAAPLGGAVAGGALKEWAVERGLRDEETERQRRSRGFNPDRLFQNQREIIDVFQQQQTNQQQSSGPPSSRPGTRPDMSRGGGGMDRQTAQDVIDAFPRGALTDPLSAETTRREEFGGVGSIRVDNQVDVTVEDQSGMDEREVERKVSDGVADLERRLNDLFRNQ